MKGQATAKRRLPSFLRWVLWVLLVQFILINVSAAWYAYRLTHFYDDPSLSRPTAKGNIFSKTWKLFTGPKFPKSIVTERPTFKYDTVQLKTAKGKIIDCWYASPDSAPKGTVILFHGITINKGFMLDEANEFRYLGYDVMLVDFRGHGNSEGNTTTIGVREAEDVKLAFDYASKRSREPVFLFGASLGSVSIAKAMHDYQLKPAGLILEMPFLSLQSYLEARARILGFPKQPFAFLTTFWIGVERGFNGFNHNTTRYVKDITCPVLMEWGDADEFVLNHETQAIYNAIASTQKKLVIYKGAEHTSFLRYDTRKWRAEVVQFLSKQGK